MRDSESNLTEILDLLWQERLLVVLVTLIFTLAVAVVSFLLPRKYQGIVLLQPISAQSQGSGLGGLASAVSQFSGIASIAGLNLTGSSGTKAEAIATLGSRLIIQRYIREQNLLPVLFRSKWDSDSQKWSSDNPENIPTLWQGMNYFEHHVIEVTENAKTGLVTMTITWRDPQIAAKWANDLVKLTNDYLRDKAISEAQRNIDFLTEQAAKTSTVEIRSAIYAVMETEIKKEMIAKGSADFALKIVDPAIASEKPSFPRPVLMTIGGFVVGLAFGIFCAVLRNGLSNRASLLPK